MLEQDNERFESFIANYWCYYLLLEKEIISLRKYVEFNEDNNKTYSLEFLLLCQAICGELDAVGKCIAHEIDNQFDINSNNNNILKWWYVIQEWYLSRTNKTAKFNRSISLEPWENFEVEEYGDRNNHRRIRLKQNCKVPKC